MRGVLNGMAAQKQRTEVLRLGDQVFGSTLRMEDGVVNDQQAAGERTAQVRFACCEGPAVKKLTGNTVRGEGLELSLNLAHLLVVGRDPDSAGPVIFDGRGQCRRQFAP